MSEKSRRVMIEAKGLSKYYGPFVAIKDISFSIPEGQIVSFLGPNGAGKSTTMKILSGYLAPSEGSASIAGCDVASNRLEAARQLGYLPENGPLYNDMTPKELLEFFGEARGLSDAKRRERIAVVVDQCALGDVLEKTIGKLSRGYRQRVGLAQALLHDPAVLIMDEPTAALGPQETQMVAELIGQLKSEGIGIFLISHDIHDVMQLCDRASDMKNGKLVGTVDVAEVTDDDLLGMIILGKQPGQSKT